MRKTCALAAEVTATTKRTCRRSPRLQGASPPPAAESSCEGAPSITHSATSSEAYSDSDTEIDDFSDGDGWLSSGEGAAKVALYASHIDLGPACEVGANSRILRSFNREEEEPVDELDTGPDNEAYPDSKCDLSQTDSEPATSGDFSFGSSIELNADSDSEADSIFEDIHRLRKEGPARPRHSDRTKELWRRESDFWEV